jgi:hypothetical protein
MVAKSKRKAGRPKKGSEKIPAAEKFERVAYQREYYAKQAATRRDIQIRECADMKRRERLLADPVEFLKWYFADRFFRPFSNDQRETISHIVETVAMGQDEIFCAPRGDWKTETVKGMAIYLILRGLLKFPVIIGATAGDAALKFNDIKKQFSANNRLADDFPEVCDPIRALNNAPQAAARQTFEGYPTDFEWKHDYVTFPRVLNVPGLKRRSDYWDCAITFRGLDGQIRGINIFGRRPDLALCDDLETRESADSDHQISTREKLLDNDVAGLAGGGELLPRIVVGTIQNNKCLTFKKLIQWGGRRYQAIGQWPDDRGMELAEEYIEIRKEEKASGSKRFDKAREFYLENRDLIEAGVVESNPYAFSQKKLPDGTPVQVSAFQRILDEAAKNGWRYVYCELQNDPPDDSKMETLGLTHSKICSRISGFEQRRVPKEAEVVVASIDLGKYACHWTVGAWRTGMIGQIVNYGVAEVHGTGTGVDKIQSEMSIRSAVLNWRNELLGGELCDRAPDIVLIDSSDFTDMAYGLIRELDGSIPTWYAVKGRNPYGTHQNVPGKKIVGNHFHASKMEADGVWLYLLDSNALKGMVHSMWSNFTFDEAQQFNPMSLSLYSAYGASGKPDSRRHLSFAKHQVAEEFREEFIPGKGLRKGWFQVNPNNHWFDAVYMNLAGAIMKGIRLPFDQAESVPAAVAPRRKRPNPNVGGGRFDRGGFGFVASR